jgi:hypothetical protein
MLRCIAVAVLASASCTPIVIDDSTPGASWGSSGATECSAAGYDGTFRYSTGIAQAFFEHEITVSKSGCYLIEEYHPAIATDGTAGSCSGLAPQKHVPLRVDYCRGQTAKTSVDQTINGDRWNEIGLLPFYVGWEGSIALGENCPDDSCFWLLDAFRLTWLADSCSEVPANRTAAAAEQQSAEMPSAAPHTEEEVNELTNGMAAELANVINVTNSTKPSMAVQALAFEPKFQADLSVFSFSPPLDGCYLVEEQHPYVSGAVQEPLAVNYCKGQRAEGQLDHTDGRHSQWNYVASLPFFDNYDGSAELPRALVESAQSSHYNFRFTRVGPSCSAGEAQVYRVQLRIGSESARRLSTEMANADAKAELAQLLAPAAQVAPARLSITHLTLESPVVAEITILPATIPDGENLHGTSPSASTAFEHLSSALADGALGPQLCTAMGVASTGCDGKLLNLFLAPSQVQRVASSTATQAKEASFMDKNKCLFIGLVSTGGALALAIAVGACVWARRRRTSKQGKSVDPEANEEAAGSDEIVAEGKPTAQKSTMEPTKAMDPAVVTASTRSSTFSDNASTATPTDIEANDAISVHTIETPPAA